LLALLICGVAAADELLVLNHVTVVDVRAASAATALERDRVVVIAAGRIRTIARAKGARLPRGARVIDAVGKFLIPGLYDMHVHTLLEERGAFCFPLFIANGITSVRDMGGSASAADVQRLRTEIAAGRIVGPRIAAAPGKIVDGSAPARDAFVNVSTADEARAWVVSAKAAHWDFVKAYNLLARDVYAALVDEARRQQLEVAGHVPFSMTALEVSDAHQRTIEHAADLLVSTSTEESALRARLAEEGPAAANSNWARAKVEIDAAATYDPRKASQLAAQFVRNGTWQCRTLVLKKMSAAEAPAALMADPRLRYIPPALQERWRNTFTKLVEPIGTPGERALRANVTIRIAGTMHRAGVKLLAGTDTPPQPYLFPGFSLHEELALLTEAGLTPLEALQTATTNPAEFLHEQASRGSLEAGKIADAVLLDGNPLADIKNTAKIAAVIVNGRYYGRAALDALLAQAAAAAKAGLQR
jgi:predicted amidohydrolase YtcJ